MGNLPYFSKTYDERVLMSSIIGTAVLREKFNNFIVHGAVAPSSSYLVGRMISLVEQTDGLKVLQLGYGTGVFTSELLQKVGENGRIVTFEIDQACEKLGLVGRLGWFGGRFRTMFGSFLDNCWFMFG